MKDNLSTMKDKLLTIQRSSLPHSSFITAACGDAPSNRASNNGIIRNGTNSGGGNINETPRAENPVTP